MTARSRKNFESGLVLTFNDSVIPFSLHTHAPESLLIGDHVWNLFEFLFLRSSVDVFCQLTIERESAKGHRASGIQFHSPRATNELGKPTLLATQLAHQKHFFARSLSLPLSSFESSDDFSSDQSKGRTPEHIECTSLFPLS